MIQYNDISGRSAVIGYDAGEDFITVYFKDGTDYTYTYISAGQYEVDQMKELARQGQGLNAYINKVTKYFYDQDYSDSRYSSY